MTTITIPGSAQQAAHAQMNLNGPAPNAIHQAALLAEAINEDNAEKEENHPQQRVFKHRKPFSKQASKKKVQQEQDTPDQVISNLMYSLFESPTAEMHQQAINTVGVHSNKMPALKDFIKNTKKLFLEYADIVQAPRLYSPIQITIMKDSLHIVWPVLYRILRIGQAYYSFTLDAAVKLPDKTDMATALEMYDKDYSTFLESDADNLWPYKSPQLATVFGGLQWRPCLDGINGSITMPPLSPNLSRFIEEVVNIAENCFTETLHPACKGWGITTDTPDARNYAKEFHMGYKPFLVAKIAAWAVEFKENTMDLSPTDIAIVDEVAIRIHILLSYPLHTSRYSPVIANTPLFCPSFVKFLWETVLYPLQSTFALVMHSTLPALELSLGLKPIDTAGAHSTLSEAFIHGLSTFSDHQKNANWHIQAIDKDAGLPLFHSLLEHVIGNRHAFLKQHQELNRVVPVIIGTKARAGDFASAKSSFNHGVQELRILAKNKQEALLHASSVSTTVNRYHTQLPKSTYNSIQVKYAPDTPAEFRDYLGFTYYISVEWLNPANMKNNGEYFALRTLTNEHLRNAYLGIYKVVKANIHFSHIKPWYIDDNDIELHLMDDKPQSQDIVMASVPAVGIPSISSVTVQSVASGSGSGHMDIVSIGNNSISTAQHKTKAQVALDCLLKQKAIQAQREDVEAIEKAFNAFWKKCAKLMGITVADASATTAIVIPESLQAQFAELKKNVLGQAHLSSSYQHGIKASTNWNALTPGQQTEYCHQIGEARFKAPKVVKPMTSEQQLTWDQQIEQIAPNAAEGDYIGISHVSAFVASSNQLPVSSASKKRKDADCDEPTKALGSKVALCGAKKQRQSKKEKSKAVDDDLD
ncbi:hypothetical protein BT96DRAFT_1021765 [Gymnopus androsaceus JB14]|uniref:Uncharacterized protein n=1 Tax=Gymnopus androsaceus JB14 TaxID=1447944 RepID=A0A6A4HDK0_9AGAR|nr:hypothetical protein BT96DRAFT_1021765 [Gymnopus androsaceus JB14]